jgi:hypothetical protein
MIQKHTKPLEKELNHQKEQKAKWKKISDRLAKALSAYQSANRLHHDSEAELHEEGQKALDVYKAATNPRSRR